MLQHPVCRRWLVTLFLLLLTGFCQLFAQSNITRVEYYINTDPGYGRATPLSITPATHLQDLALQIDPAGLSSGVHTLGVRALDAEGKWSLDNRWLFFKPYNNTTAAAPVPQLSYAEYYIDTDPGFGKAIPVTVSGTNSGDILIYIDPSTITPGVHSLGFRAKDENGSWSLDNRWLFFKPYNNTTTAPPVPNLSFAEYYIDTDPGYGNGTPVAVNGINSGDLLINIDPATLTPGVHSFYFRAKDANGSWSLDNKWFFFKPYNITATAAPVPDLVYAEYYIDTDPGYKKGIPISVSGSKDIANLAVAINMSDLTSGTHKFFFRALDADGRWSLDNVLSFTVPVTIDYALALAGSVSSTLCRNTSFAVAYTATGTYNSGNQFKVELSDKNGSFATPTVIGSVTSTTSGSINCTIPSNAEGGNQYRVRVVSTNPELTSLDNGQNITIGLTAEITCPSNITVNTDAGKCSAALNFVATGTGTITYSHQPGSDFPVGTTWVTVSATNDCGPTTCQFSVTVVDNEAPVVKTKNIIVPLVNGSATINPNDVNDNSLDNCGITGMTLAPYQFTTSNLGENIVTFSVSDANGNRTETNAIVTIINKLNATVSTTSTTCGLNNGSATAVVEGGTAPYRYLWSNGATTASISNLAPGVYSVTVTDAYDLSATASATVAATNTQPAVLSFTNVPGFTNSVVYPTSGAPGDAYRFEVRFTHADGVLPLAGYPRILMDYEGNGSYTNEKDRLFQMMEKDPADQDVTDGKDYYFVTNTLPASRNWRTLIVANDVNGCSVSAGPYSTPLILATTDITIFANDISFSNNNPEISSPLTVKARIHNYSGYDAENFVVRLVNQFKPGEVYPDIVVPRLSSNPLANSVEVTWNITTPDEPAWCPMQVIIDATNVLEEPNKLDNQAIRPFVNGRFKLPGDIEVTASVNPFRAPSGTLLTVAGKAIYRNTAVELQDPSCAGATVVATIVETNQSFTGYTNSYGEYRIQFYGPATPRTYNLKIDVTDYTLNGTVTTTFETTLPPPCPLPDLTSTIDLGPGTITPPPGYYYNTTIIVAGQTLTGTATVTNMGTAGVTTSTQLVIDLPDGTPVPGPFTVPSLAPGEKYVSNLPAMQFNNAKQTYATAIADYNSQLTECTKGNNAHKRMILVLPALPDIYAHPQSAHTRARCEFNTIGFPLRNLGGLPTGNFNARLTVSRDGNVIETLNKLVSNIDPLYWSSVEFDYSPPQAGNYSFHLQCDYPNAIAEDREDNNDVTVAVLVTECLPDLVVYDCKTMDVKPVDPQAGNNIIINATVANIGKGNSSRSFMVYFNVAGIVYPYSFTGVLASKEERQISITVPAPVHGNNTVLVTIDADNDIDESAEYNNTTTAILCWDFQLVNYACQSRPYIDSVQVKNKPFYLSTGVYNYGLYEASHLGIQFEVSGPGISGWQVIGTTVRSADTYCNCPYVFTLPATYAFEQTGRFTIRITADFGNEYTECNEGNNVLLIPITVVDRLPDFFVRSEYIAPSKLNPDLDEEINLDITYKNVGKDHLDPLGLKVLVDEVTLSNMRVNGLFDNTHNTVRLAERWSSSIRGVHVIRAVIDSENEVSESNELNNEATRAIVVGKAPNLKFETFTTSNAYPSIGAEINISATIKNAGYVGCYATYQLLFVNDNGTETVIRQQNIAVDSLGSITLSLPWVVTDPTTIVRGRIINTSPVEYDDLDNEAELELGKMMISLTTTDASCPEATDGKIKVNIVGGQRPYNIIWADGKTADSISVGTGAYYVTVYDANGTQVKDTANVGMQNEVCSTERAIKITSAVPTTICAGAAFPVVIEVSGGYDANNVFLVQLSDSTGSFDQPVIIGNFSNGNSNRTDVQIPDTTMTGRSYRIRVVATNPEVFGENNGVDIFIQAALLFYEDADGDGYGNINSFLRACSQPEGYVSDNADCDDNDASIYPDAPEICDGKDNDCDGDVDETLLKTYYYDADGDGYGNPNSFVTACTMPQGYVLDNTDCDDEDGTVYPGAVELCDGKDNNCNAQADENCPISSIPNIYTISGIEIIGYNGDNQTANTASLNMPQDVATDINGNIFIADRLNHRVRKIDKSGIISTVAGIGIAGFSGDGGPATLAKLNHPTRVAVDRNGNIYVSEQENHRIRKIANNGVISTFAGTGIAGYNGENLTATEAQLNYPSGIAIDGFNNVYIADAFNQRIRVVNSDGLINTFAGTGETGYSGDGDLAINAKLNYPSYIIVDSLNNVFITDNHKVRKISPNGIINTIAGTGVAGYSGDGGLATVAQFNGIHGLAIDKKGNLYLSDYFNQRIRRIDNTGNISTFGGNGTEGFSGDNGPATSAQLRYPQGLSIQESGNLLVADLFNHRIRSIGTQTEYIYYYDADQDGFGNKNLFIKSINRPANYVVNDYDCNDNDPTIYPGAPELCDGKDNNCNGEVDEGLTPPQPIITASGSTTLCPGGTVTLTASGGSSYLWSTGATTSSILVTASGTYTVSETSGCGAISEPAIINIEDNQPPVITCPQDIIVNASVVKAFYPLINNLADASGNLGDILLQGNPAPATADNGVCTNGIYIHRDGLNSPGGQNVSTPYFSTFNTNDFEVSVDFKINAYATRQASGHTIEMPIIIGGMSYRWIGIVVRAAGDIGVKYNNGAPEWSSFKPDLRKWYTAVLQYHEGNVLLYVNGSLVLSKNIGTLYTGNDFNFTTSNFGAGNTLDGCIRNLKIYNGGLCQSPVSVPSPNISDNCNFTISGVRSDGLSLTAAYPIGTTSISWTATDAGGNTATCSSRVTVNTVLNTFYRDADGDGYGTAGVTTQTCSSVPPTGYVTTNTDCNDADNTIYPGAPELCDGKDNNCNGQIDEGVTITWYRDADGDGYGNPSMTTQACAAPAGYVSNNTDCDDSNPAIHPATRWYLDADNDGYYTGTAVTQCISPGAGYKYTGLAGGGDCNDNNAAINPTTQWYLDADNDGYYTGTAITQCTSPGTGYKYTGLIGSGDCNDNNAAINPATQWFLDADNDGYYTGNAVIGCTTPGTGYKYIGLLGSGDCNDNNAAINPATKWYLDADNDGYYTGTAVTQCTSPDAGYKYTGLAGAGDCDDNNPSINPGALEICGNNIDDNCDNQADEGCNNKLLVTISNMSVYESEGQVIVPVRLSRYHNEPVSVTYKTTDGTARSKGNKNSPKDYTAASGTITIPAGSLSANITILIDKDNIQEPAEEFYIDLGRPVNAGVDQTRAVITILDGGPATITRKQVDVIQEAGIFDLKAFPNPSTSEFTLQVQSDDLVNKIQLHIIDISGRLVQKIENVTAGQLIRIGNNYRPGMYIVQMIQGTKRKQLKLVKQPD